MSLRKEVIGLVKEVKENLSLRYGHERVLQILSEENQRLREEIRRLTTQNERVLDRLMAKDFESYSTYKAEDPELVGPFSIDSKFEPLKDEANIGEVIEE